MVWNRKRDAAMAVSAAALVLVLSAPSMAIDPNNQKQAAGTAPVPVSKLPAAPANGEMGFVFSDFSPAIYPGLKENCPTGTAATVKEAFLATVSPQERIRLLKPENENELTQRWKASGIFPDGKNLCTNYNQYPDRPTYVTVQN